MPPVVSSASTHVTRTSHRPNKKTPSMTGFSFLTSIF
jgi:hypothetical protein